MPDKPVLPGAQVENPPPLVDPVQPSIDKKKITEGMWAALNDAPLPALAEVMAWIARHPEVFNWKNFNPTPGRLP